jgi:salicylate hydroxylase
LTLNTKSLIPLLIVGGGIGGLTTALALARKGFPVHLIEREAEFGEIGAGIQLAPNASKVLDELGVLAEISKYVVYPEGIVWMDALSGKHITTLDLGDNFVKNYRYRYFVMHRSDLLTCLLQACLQNPLITLETSRPVVRVEDLGDTARVTCADGTAYETAALVAADGLHSVVRAQLIDDSAPICAEFVAYRGAIPIEEISNHAGLNNVFYWVGPNMHLVQYPVRRGELYNQVAVFKSTRYRPGADDWGTVDELEEKFSSACEGVRAGLVKIKRNRRWPLFDRLPADNWTRHRVTLLGDAAHPMLQYIAQGACQALEDAMCLAEKMEEFGGDIPKTFAAYQAERFPRTARVQTSARQFGEIAHIDGMGLILRNAYFARRASDDFTYTDWLYGY